MIIIFLFVAYTDISPKEFENKMSCSKTKLNYLFAECKTLEKESQVYLNELTHHIKQMGTALYTKIHLDILHGLQ